MKKYYWLKLMNEFFTSRPDIKLLNSLPNGKLYILLFLQMLTASLATNGRLRFSEDVAYEPETLAAVMGFDETITKEAWDNFIKYRMMEILEDGTIYLPGVEEMTGYETSDAIRMREARANANKNEQCSKMFSKDEQCHIEIEKEIEKEKYKRKAQKNPFNVFPQNPYDFKALEQALTK